MMRSPEGSRGVRSADRGRGGPFASLVAEAGRHPEAASALAGCHAELPADARRALIEAVWTDARAAGDDPAPALLALLAVEDDLANAQRLRALLEDLVEPTRIRQAEPRAWLETDDDGGRAVLAEPLHGPFVEAMGLRWQQDRVTGWGFEPMVRAEDVPGWVRPWALDPELHHVPPAFAIDVVVEALWRHRRRHGPLPPALSRLAHLL